MTSARSVSSPSWAEGTAWTRKPARSSVSPASRPSSLFSRQTQLQGMVEDRLGQHDDRARRGRQQVGQRPRIEVVGMLVAGQDEIDVAQFMHRGRGPRHADVRPAGGLRISSSGARRDKGRRRASPCRDLIRKPLCPSHQTASEPGGGTVRRSRRSVPGLGGRARSSTSNSFRTSSTPSTMALALATATCRAVCEKPQSGVTDTRPGVDVPEHVPQPLGDQLGGLDPGVLDVDQPDSDIHRLGQLRPAARSRPSRGWRTRARVG